MFNNFSRVFQHSVMLRVDWLLAKMRVSYRKIAPQEFKLCQVPEPSDSPQTFYSNFTEEPKLQFSTLSPPGEIIWEFINLPVLQSLPVILTGMMRQKRQILLDLLKVLKMHLRNRSFYFTLVLIIQRERTHP